MREQRYSCLDLVCWNIANRKKMMTSAITEISETTEKARVCRPKWLEHMVRRSAMRTVEAPLLKMERLVGQEHEGAGICKRRNTRDKS